MTEHISQQILYARHPEPESHYRLENPSKTSNFIEPINPFACEVCAYSSQRVNINLCTNIGECIS